jgi:predicted transcriptional regulator
VSTVDQIAQLVTELGLTALEAQVYVYLLQHSPATGYKVANGIGHSFTNTYKALASLKAKGAVLEDEGESKLARAIPLEELFDQFQSRFRDLRRRATEAMAQLPQSVEDTRIYQLATVPQVIERCRTMLAAAEERVLMELFPEPLEMLRETVEETAARGVDISARVYRPGSLAGVRMVQSPFGEDTLESMRSQWLALFVDGRQFLLGHLFTGGKGVYQAIWSRNPFLARAFYDYVNSDLHHYVFRARMESARSLEEVRAAYRETQAEFPPGGDLGFREMQAFFKQAFDAPETAEGDES